MEELFTDTQLQDDLFISDPVPVTPVIPEQESPDQEPIPEPSAEPVPETVSEPVSEPVSVTDSEAVSESIREAIPVADDVAGEPIADPGSESITDVKESNDYVDYTELLEQLHGDLQMSQQELVLLRGQAESITSGLIVSVFLLAFLAGILLSQVFTSYFRP